MLHARMLRYLDEVVRAGSIRRAAERLHVASSSINRQIIELEAELGTPIFERLPRRLRLTAAGEILIAHIRQTLRDYERARFRILELEGVGRGTIRVATMNGIAGGLFPELCARFSQSYPGVKFEITSQFAPGIVAAVEEGDVAFGLGYNIEPTAALRTVATYEGRLGLVVAPHHPLAERAQVRLSEVAYTPLVFAEETLTIRGVVDAACKRANVTLRPRFSTNSVQAMKVMVADGQLATFLSPPDVAHEVARRELVFLPLKDRMPSNPLRLIQRPGAPISPSAAVFLEWVRERLATIAALGLG